MMLFAHRKFGTAVANEGMKCVYTLLYNSNMRRRVGSEVFVVGGRIGGSLQIFVNSTTHPSHAPTHTTKTNAE